MDPHLLPGLPNGPEKDQNYESVYHDEIFARTDFLKSWNLKINGKHLLGHVQFVINCRYSVAQMYTLEDMLAHYLGTPFIDEVMRL